MALITCPECGQSVSDKASKCPKCGYPIAEHPAPTKEHPEPVITAAQELPQDAPAAAPVPNDAPTVSTPVKKAKHFPVTAAIVGVIILLGIFACTQLFRPALKVKDLTISKWRLTDSSSYYDYYEGTVTTKQKKPFIAVIGEYETSVTAPQLVYVENGTGTIQMSVSSDQDPSTTYRPIGYFSGRKVSLSDLKVKYTDSNYNDWSFNESTHCNVAINIDTNRLKNGLLLFDIENKTSGETLYNRVATIIDGHTVFNLYAELPYKTRGIEISIVPKLFCKSSAVKQEDYSVEKEYTAELNEGSYYNSYSGTQTMSFPGYDDGFVLYTMELLQGGSKENRNVANYQVGFLHKGELTFSTYDSVDSSEKILRPKYEFNIAGYISWNSLTEKEFI